MKRSLAAPRPRALRSVDPTTPLCWRPPPIPPIPDAAADRRASPAWPHAPSLLGDRAPTPTTGSDRAPGPPVNLRTRQRACLQASCDQTSTALRGPSATLQSRNQSSHTTQGGAMNTTIATQPSIRHPRRRTLVSVAVVAALAVGGGAAAGRLTSSDGSSGQVKPPGRRAATNVDVRALWDQLSALPGAASVTTSPPGSSPAVRAGLTGHDRKRRRRRCRPLSPVSGVDAASDLSEDLTRRPYMTLFIKTGHAPLNASERSLCGTTNPTHPIIPSSATSQATAEGEDMRTRSNDPVIGTRMRVVALVVAIAAALGVLATPAAAQVTKAQPKATEVGVTPSEIHIAVIADVDNPLVPGLFAGSRDAGVGLRQVHQRELCRPRTSVWPVASWSSTSTTRT